MMNYLHNLTGGSLKQYFSYRSLWSSNNDTNEVKSQSGQSGNPGYLDIKPVLKITGPLESKKEVKGSNKNLEVFSIFNSGKINFILETL